MSEKIKIVVVDDHQLLREAFASVLNDFEFVEVIGMAENGIQALELLTTVEPDILFLDIDMPIMNGEVTAREVRKNYPNIKIIMLSMYAESYYVLEFIKIGVSSYLYKGCSLEEIRKAIECVQKEGTYFNESILETIKRNESTKPKNCVLGQEPLEETEVSVLKLICEGKRGKEIAEVLNISTDMVDYHKKNIKKKTNLDSTAELVKHAIKHGFVTL